MKQINLWQSFLIEILSKNNDKIFKSEWANDYIEADNIAIGFFKDLDDTQCILISKIE